MKRWKHVLVDLVALVAPVAALALGTGWLLVT